MFNLPILQITLIDFQILNKSHISRVHSPFSNCIVTCKKNSTFQYLGEYMCICIYIFMRGIGQLFSLPVLCNVYNFAGLMDQNGKCFHWYIS